jgi:tellurite resistance protein TerA
VFACIYAGVPSFDQANAVVTLSPASGPPIEAPIAYRR